MKIVVAYKWASNPQDVTVGADGSVDWSRAKGSVSEYDPVAFELARTLADAAGAEVIGLSVGDASIDTPLARKAALSRGLDRLVLVADDALAGASGTRLAAVLAAAVRSIGDVDLVLAGESSVDVGDKQVALTTAGALGWIGLSGVTAVSGTPGALVVERDSVDGVETLDVTGPVVLAATADAVVPRVPGMKEILAAAKKPVEVLALGDLDVANVADVDILSAAKPDVSTRAAVMFDASDVAAAAAQLTAALRQSSAL